MPDWLSYARFERLIAALLLAGMGVVILLTVVHFGVALVEITLDYDAGWDYRTFQTLFDRVLAAVIALELARTVQQMAAGKHGLTQVRTVVLIGVLAVVRKLILLEIETTSGAFLAGLAAAILALGAVYALILWIESRPIPDGEPPTPGAKD